MINYFLLLFILLILLILSNPVEMLLSLQEHLKSTICYNHSLMINIQYKQLLQVRKYKQFKIKSDNINHQQYNDMIRNQAIRFYSSAYNPMKLNFSTFNNSLLQLNGINNDINNRILYFLDIYKNANLNMKYYLCNYKYYIDNPHDQLLCTREIMDEYLNCNTNIISIKERENNGNHSGKCLKFPFGIIRHPMKRFISGYSEIEFQNNWFIYQNNIPIVELSPKYSMGTIERFKEIFDLFVNQFIDHYDGTIRNASAHSSSFGHICTQYGSVLFMSKKIQCTRPHLYKLENFDEEMKRFSIESNFFDFYKSYEYCDKKDIMSHISSLDENGVRLAAESFLSYASKNAFKEFGEKYGNKRLKLPSDSSEKEALEYYIVICRIYLLDFICLDYEIPRDCQFILDEVYHDIF